MPSRRAESAAFAFVLAALVLTFFHDALRPGRILSPADVLLVEASFQEPGAPPYEPANRLLMDPVLQFQPWLEFNRAEIRAGRLPSWNPLAGCGVPHIANGQSATFDPFNAIVVLGPWPITLGWAASARLWFAGMGAFLLARSWGLGPWGRWFAGLCFPFTGFLVVWLLYPVTPAAVWLPWLLLATDRAIRSPGLRAVGTLALAVGGVLVAGHVQTSAHVLLATGVLAAWRLSGSREWRRATLAWSVGVGLGVGIAAAQVAPLGEYLSKSPVWGERRREHPPWWKLTKPRLLESVCTALPYVYGSQRRGHPNLARGLGVHNLNESAGGFAGLATLAWLAPLAAIAVGRKSETRFLLLILGVGFLAAFKVPPIDNLLRSLPVLGVTDNRRLTLWVSFALTFLGAIGIDAAARGAGLSRRWSIAWATASLTLLAGAVAVPMAVPSLRARAEGHYRDAAVPLDPAEASRRIDRQVEAMMGFTPRYFATGGLAFLAMIAASEIGRRRVAVRQAMPALLLAATLVDLFAFGAGLNPAIDREVQDREPPVVARLREILADGRRAVGVGEELPPNVLMRFGLGDPRNYDSVELSRSLDYFEPLYEETDEARSSRRTISWRTIERALPRLREAAVGAIVAASPPPDASLFSGVERVGDAWIARLDAPPRVSLEGRGLAIQMPDSTPAAIRIEARAESPARLVVRETWDEGWSATVDGAPALPELHKNTFMSIPLESGHHEIMLTYSSHVLRTGLWASAVSLAAALLALTRRPRSGLMEGGLDGTGPAG